MLDDICADIDDLSADKDDWRVDWAGSTHDPIQQPTVATLLFMLAMLFGQTSAEPTRARSTAARPTREDDRRGMVTIVGVDGM